MNVGLAILVGQLVVNLPVILIILGVFCVGVFLMFLVRALLPSLPGWSLPLWILGLLIIGALVGWLWWSFSVPRWRRWALRKGVAEDQLQKWAVATGLVWPKGSTFEKTEFRVKE